MTSAINMAVVVTLITWKVPLDNFRHDFKEVIAHAVNKFLRDRTPKAREVRLALLKRILDAEPLLERADPRARTRFASDLISTATAAKMLNVSRPHVTMLADLGKLGEVQRTNGGHRRLRAGAVHAYLASQLR